MYSSRAFDRAEQSLGCLFWPKTSVQLLARSFTHSSAWGEKTLSWPCVSFCLLSYLYHLTGIYGALMYFVHCKQSKNCFKSANSQIAETWKPWAFHCGSECPVNPGEWPRLLQCCQTTFRDENRYHLTLGLSTCGGLVTNPVPALLSLFLSPVISACKLQSAVLIAGVLHGLRLQARSYVWTIRDLKQMRKIRVHWIVYWKIRVYFSLALL